MSSRDLFAASRDLLVNIKDFLVICDPTKVISINNHHLHPINSPPWGGGGGLLAFYLFAHLACSLLTLSHLLSVRGQNPNSWCPPCSARIIFLREMMILRWSEA